MKEILEQLSAKINDKLSNDEKYRKKLNGVTKTFLVEFDGKDYFNFKLENGKISPIEEGKVEADVNVTVSSDIFRKILSKEIDALSAYFEKKIQVKASLMDKLLLTELLK